MISVCTGTGHSTVHSVSGSFVGTCEVTHTLDFLVPSWGIGRASS